MYIKFDNNFDKYLSGVTIFQLAYRKKEGVKRFIEIVIWGRRIMIHF